MAKNKKKTKKKATRKPKEVSKLEKIKKYESDLYVICMENIKNIATQGGLTEEEVLKFIAKNGIDKVKIIKGFVMAEPIFEIMKRNWALYAKAKMIREKLEDGTRYLFMHDMEEEVTKIDKEVEKIEQEKKFYHEQPDKTGHIDLKDKWYVEMRYWQEQLSKAKTVEEYKFAQGEINKLQKKKTSMHIKNISPNIRKYMAKITGGIQEAQNTMGEMTKPFRDVGDESGFSNKKKKVEKENDFGFNESIFKGVPSTEFGEAPRTVKSKKNYDPMGGFDI